MEDPRHLQKEDIEEVAGMMEEVSAAGPAPDMTVGAFAL